MPMIRNRDRIRRLLANGILVVVLTISTGCQKSEPPAQTSADSMAVVAAKPVIRPWAILYSYSPIGLELREMVQTRSDTVWAGREIAYADWTEPVVLGNTGVGLSNAAATTQWIIDRYNPQGVIFCGVAAPLNKAHQIGDIMIPESFATFDFGYWGDSFMTDSVTVGNADSAGFHRALTILVDPGLYERLGAAADRAAFQLRSVKGRLPEIHRGGIGVSADAFLDNKTKRDQLYKQMKAQITDTESAAVVQTCVAAGIPVVVVRACAAPAGESTTPESQATLGDFFKVAARNIALVIQHFFETSES